MIDGWLSREPDLTFDLLSPSAPDFSRLYVPGAYVLMRSDQGAFEYPQGAFSTYYIGESGASARRLKEHRRYAMRASASLRDVGSVQQYWYARYGYAGKFGANLYWFATREGQTCKELETAIADEFYWKAGALPICNGKWPSTWPKV